MTGDFFESDMVKESLEDIKELQDIITDSILETAFSAGLGYNDEEEELELGEEGGPPAPAACTVPSREAAPVTGAGESPAGSFAERSDTSRGFLVGDAPGSGGTERLS